MRTSALRAAFYGRVSTTEQAHEGMSLDDQRRRCVGRIEAEGWRLVGEFVDEGVSGAKASRPRLDALMAECRARQIDVIVVTRLDRFGRSNRHLENALGELDDLGVAFVSLSESIDSSSAAGRMMRTMLGAAAEFERASIRERTMGGLAAAVRAGYWAGGPPPFGFTTVDDGPHKRLAIYEPEAEVLRTAVALILDDRLTTKQAADRLNVLDMKPRRAQRWVHNNLRRTLLDSCMSGEWTYARQRGTRRAKGSAPQAVAIPAIIPVERHQALMKVLGASSSIRRKSNAYLLAGGRLVAQCGSHYHGYPRPSGRRQYKCYAHRTYAPERCDCRMIDANDVESAVWGAVCDLLSAPDRLLAMAADYVGLRDEQGAVDRRQVETAERKIKRLVPALARAYEDRYRDGRDLRALDLAIANMEDELAAARTHLATVAAWESENQRTAERVADLRALAELATDRLRSMTVYDRRRVIELLDVRATVAAWALCETCAGRGKVESKPKLGGSPCPACHMTRWLPSLRVEGVLYERLLRSTLGAATSVAGRDQTDPPLPFAVTDLGVA